MKSIQRKEFEKQLKKLARENKKTKKIVAKQKEKLDKKIMKQAKAPYKKPKEPLKPIDKILLFYGIVIIIIAIVFGIKVI